MSGGSHGLGGTWVPVDAGLEMSPSDRSSGNLALRGLLRLHSSFSCCQGRELGSSQHGEGHQNTNYMDAWLRCLTQTPLSH